MIRFTAGTQQNKKLGDSIPAVFFIPKTTRLLICTGLGSNANKCYKTNPLPLERWATVAIVQIQQGNKYFFTINLNGKQLVLAENKNPRYYPGVSIYRSDRFYGPAPAKIRSLKYKNLPGGKNEVYYFIHPFCCTLKDDHFKSTVKFGAQTQSSLYEDTYKTWYPEYRKLSF